VSVSELTAEKVDSMPAEDARSVFPVSDMSTLLSGVTDPGGSLDDIFSDVASWDLDFPAEIPPAVQPKMEAGVSGETVERPLPVYGNKTMSSNHQPVDQHYQAAASWPQPPHQITQHVRPGSCNGVRMHPMSAGLSPHQQYNSIQQGAAGLTHGSVEMRNHMPPSQPCARQAVVPFGNMQPCQQRDMQGPPQYLQHRPPVMPNHASQMRTMSPGLQHSMMLSQPTMMSAAPMSNQLHNLQVMVNNQTSMMQRGHINVSPALGPSGSGSLPDPMMQGKMQRNGTRMMNSGRHSGVTNDSRLFQSSEYLPQPTMMRQSQAQLHEKSHPAPPAGFHNQPPLQHGMMHGQAGPVVQQTHPMPNHHSAMMANHPSMMPAQPELRPHHFSGRSHGMGIMSPMHRGMVHSSGANRSQMGINAQQMVIMKQQQQQQQQPVQMQHQDRMMAQQSQVISDKTGAAFQWLSSCSTANMMVQPAGLQNVAQACHSPAVNQFAATVCPTAGSAGSHGRQSNAAFTTDIDSLSFLSDHFLSQGPDDGYCPQQQMMQPASSAGIKHVVKCSYTRLKQFIKFLL